MQNGLTGLIVACKKGFVNIVKALLEAKADTDISDKVHVVLLLYISERTCIFVHLCRMLVGLPCSMLQKKV